MAPHRGETEAGRRDQTTSWAAVNYLLRSGNSWSGRERNNAYVNLGSGRFADVSYLAGLGYVDDARGVAAVDWDGDGDLDLWVNNRSSPKLRYMRNNDNGANHFLALRLTGRRCNWDAVGARVELLRADGRTMIKTVRAGVNYTVQGSKWIHFGLGPDETVVDLTVRWPDGARSTYEGIATDRRYLITQDRPAAEPFEPFQIDEALPSEVVSVPWPSRAASVPLGSPLPLPPDLGLVDFEGTIHRLGDLAGGPVLINLWASWCGGCRLEFADFAGHRALIEDSGLTILACSVDVPEDRGKAVAAAKELGLWFPAGMADADLMSMIDVAKNVIFDRYEDLPVPTSLLIDGQGRLTHIYLGPCDATALVDDVRRLDRVRTDVDALYSASAHPSAGTWARGEMWATAQAGNQLVRMTSFLTGEGRDLLIAYYADRLGRFVAERKPPAGALAKASAALRGAARALIANDPEEAASVYRQVLAALPDDVGALVGLTAALLEVGGPVARAEAVTAFETAQPKMREPENAEDWAVFGTVLYRLGKPEESIRYLEMAAREDPDNPVHRAYLGSALIDVGRDAEGIERVLSVIEEVPPTAALHLKLASALDRRGQSADAVSHYERGLELSPEPETIDDASRLGQTSLRVGRYPEAIALLERVVAEDASRLVDRGMLGLALARAGRDADAVGHLEAALPALPPEADNEHIFGIVLARSGDLERASAHFDRAVELNPEHLEALKSSAIAHARLGRPDDAITRYRAFLEQSPGDADVLGRLAGALDRAGRPGEAIEAYREALRAAPDNGLATFRLGWLLATAEAKNLRNGPEAVRLAESLVQTAGRLPALLDVLAAAYAETGQFDKAVETAGEAFEAARAREQLEQARRIEQRLSLYRRGKPYHGP